MMSILTYILDILYPVRCGLCNDIVDRMSPYFVCKDCLSRIEFISENCCIKCGKSIKYNSESICYDCRVLNHHFDKCISAAEYKGILKNAIIRYKFYNQRHLLDTFTELILKKLDKYNDIDFITFVPMHPLKLKERGFNQSEILAKNVSKKKKLIFVNDCLIKVKNTKNQSTLSRFERQNNIKGVFKVANREIIKDKNVLIVDDVYTTGATLSECAKALKDSGAAKVYGISIASGSGF